MLGTNNCREVKVSSLSGERCHDFELLTRSAAFVKSGSYDERTVVQFFSEPHRMQASEFDVLIVGGGLAGLSLACALRDTRLRLGLVEQRPPQRPAGWDARVYAVSPANAAFLREIGAWKHMAAERIAPLHAMQIFGDGGAELDFSAYETGIPELGWILESSLMACELWESAKRQGNLSLCCPAAPQSLAMASEAAVLTLANGDTLSAKLLVGADGRDSWVREALGCRRSTPRMARWVWWPISNASARMAALRGSGFVRTGCLPGCRWPEIVSRSSGPPPTRTPEQHARDVCRRFVRPGRSCRQPPVGSLAIAHSSRGVSAAPDAGAADRRPQAGAGWRCSTWHPPALRPRHQSWLSGCQGACAPARRDARLAGHWQRAPAPALSTRTAGGNPAHAEPLRTPCTNSSATTSRASSLCATWE
jgi:hypothetical protein